MQSNIRLIPTAKAMSEANLSKLQKTTGLQAHQINGRKIELRYTKPLPYAGIWSTDPNNPPPTAA